MVSRTGTCPMGPRRIRASLGLSHRLGGPKEPHVVSWVVKPQAFPIGKWLLWTWSFHDAPSKDLWSSFLGSLV